MGEKNASITFYGVRGSIPTPGKDTAEFGGNTSCVEVLLGSKLFILDAGTGIRALGDSLLKRYQKINGDIFITNTHWDHIQGFPFFGPVFLEGNSFRIFGPGKKDASFEDLLRNQMHSHFFPVQIEHLKAHLEFIQIEDKQKIQLDDDITVMTSATNHPGGCLSYRIQYKNYIICYLTDTEHSAKTFESLVSHAKNADIIIYDATYTEEEYHGYNGRTSKKGWGHSTWLEGIKLCRAAGGKKLVLFHHDIHHTDSDMKAIEKAAKEVYPDTIAAREGMTIYL